MTFYQDINLSSQLWNIWNTAKCLLVGNWSIKLWYSGILHTWKRKRRQRGGEKEKKKRTLFEFIGNDLQDKVNLKNPGVCSMLPLVGEIKGVIYMSSEKISRTLTTEFVCEGEPGHWDTREERKFIFYYDVFYNFWIFTMSRHSLCKKMNEIMKIEKKKNKTKQERLQWNSKQTIYCYYYLNMDYAPNSS